MSTDKKKPSAFATPRAVETTRPHPFTPQLAREVAAAPPTLPKDAKVTAFATRLPPDLQRMVKTSCAQRGRRLQDAVYEALWQWLNNQEPQVRN